MEAVILCEVPETEAAVPRLILDRVTLLEVQGVGALGFVGNEPGAPAGGRTVIAFRLDAVERAEALMEAWRREGGIPDAVGLRLIRVARTDRHTGFATMLP